MKRSVLLLTLTMCAGFATEANARWDRIYDFGQPMSLVYFIDEQTGFVGSKVKFSPAQIYRSDDGGMSWTLASTPFFDGRVTRISMNGDTGYATIESGQTAIWKTVDRGRSWFDISPRNFAQSVITDAVDGLDAGAALIVSSWDGGTWTNHFPSAIWNLQLPANTGARPRTNGVATNGQDVVVTDFYDREWFSHDGGRTWGRANDIPESWSIYALAGTRSFYAASEGDESDRQRTIYRSIDGGERWQALYTFPDWRVDLNGHIDGGGRRLYVQTDEDADRGMFRSDDLGVTWHSIAGPSNTRDTRFSVLECGRIVYALDRSGDLYRTLDGGDGTITGTEPSILDFDRDTIFISGHSCRSTRVALSIENPGCETARLESASVTGTATVTLGNADPRDIISADSLIFTHSDPTQLTDTSIVTVGSNGEQRKIVIISRNILELSFRLGQPVPEAVGELVSIPIFVSNLRSGVRVDGVTMSLKTDLNLLADWSVTNGTATESNDRVTIDLTFDPPLDNNYDIEVPVAILRSKNYLTTTNTTLVTLDSVDVLTTASITPCTSSTVVYVQSPTCGDSTIRDLLLRERDGISEISPSPVRGLMQVEINSASGTELQVIDMLGRALELMMSPRPGGLTVDCTPLKAGTYMLLLKHNGRVTDSRSFVKID
ncbi:MAG TPA: T9SS type A sorting domain-containing protein [Candidatus Kapabacteria bacterium]|nr:T9SS type A sorting domain-containing protein [Candidatus Kapabacteria bacterium]